MSAIFIFFYFLCFGVLANQPTEQSGELVGREFGTVAVGVSNRLQATGDTQHVTRKMLQVTPDKSHIFI